MILLTGEYELSIDGKYRLFIPARVREQIDEEQYGSGFYMVHNRERIISLYPEKYYQRIALAVVPRMATPDELLTYERVNFALAGRVELDRQGRVLLGEKAARRAALTEQVMLLGVRDHLELWAKDRWERYLVEYSGTNEQILLEARQEALRKEREAAGW